MKKRITAIILTLAMICAVSCNDGTTAPDVTTVGSDAPIVPQETTTTPVTEAPLILDDAHAELPVYESSPDVSRFDDNVFSNIQKKYDDKGYDPKAYLVRFPDMPNLALVCETFLSDGSSLHNRIKTVYFNGYRYDKEIFLLGGNGLVLQCTEDVLAIVEQGGTVPGNGVIICKNGVKEFDPSVDYHLFPKVVDGEMTYKLKTTKSCWLEVSAGAVLDMNGEELYQITGVVKATENGVFLDEATRETMDDLFMSEQFRQIREENNLETFEEYKEYIRTIMKIQN